jgi:uncharacterized phage-associated protein
MLLADDVARWLRFAAHDAVRDRGHAWAVSAPKLQSLLYYAQAWRLALADAPLFPEPLEARAHGPVVEAIHRRYQLFGHSPLPLLSGEERPVLDVEREAHLGNIWRAYGALSAERLTAMICAETPWQAARARAAADPFHDATIPQAELAACYRALARFERRLDGARWPSPVG